MNIKVYGCRGSIAMSHTGGSVYGGNTSCMRLESNGYHLIIDAGSGLMMFEKELRAAYLGYPNNFDVPVDILISHLHVDHTIGLCTFEAALKQGSNVRIYTCCRSEGKPLREQVFGAYKPPNWPVPMPEIVTAQVVPVELGVPFDVGPFTITAFRASHPDMTLSFHVTDGRVNVVHLLDSEALQMESASYDELQHYCSNADLVVFDAAYSPKDYDKRAGWGHSTVPDGVRLAKLWGCKRMMFAHFSQQYSDEELDSWAKYFDLESQYIMAYDGIELTL